MVKGSGDMTEASAIVQTWRNGQLLGVKSDLERNETLVEQGTMEHIGSSVGTENVWTPSWRQFRPISGIVSLGVAVACMVASFAVLVASNRQPVRSWSIRPTVSLAILSAVGAGAIRYAQGCGAHVAWWYKSMQGSTIRGLEYQWQASHGVLTALTRFRYTPWISTTTLLTMLIIFEGAMLQRAASVVLSTQDEDVSLQIMLSPELPLGFSGIEYGSTVQQSSMSSRIFQDSLQDKTMLVPDSGCEGSARCSGKVHAPGVSMLNCQSKTWPITTQMLRSPNATWGTYRFEWTVPVPGQGNVTFYTNPAFIVTINPLSTYENTSQPFPAEHSNELWTRAESGKAGDVSEPEVLNVTTGIATWTPSGGAYVLRACFLLPAVLEYEVQIESDTLTLPANTGKERLVALANNTARFAPNIHRPHQATMDGFTFALETFYNANATASSYAGAGAWLLNPDTFNADVSKYYIWDSPNGVVNFTDPLPDLVSRMNNLMFRGGLAAAHWPNLAQLIDPGLSPNQTMMGKQQKTETVYHTDFRWFAGAAVLDMLAVLAVLSLFWGWWTLPKNLKLQSPFELALAFNSPLVSNINSGAGSQGVVADLGNVSVAYGLLPGYNPMTKTPSEPRGPLVDRLTLTEKARVSRPYKGARIAL